MFEGFLSPPIWPLKNSVNVYNLLWLSQSTDYLKTPKLLKWLKVTRQTQIFDKHNLSLMSCTAITSKFKMRWFL